MEHVIVIGGSAGALEPLLEIVGTLPDELVAPIAIVIHLSPTHPSLVPALLARVSQRTVREAEDKEPLAAGAVYVAPPDYHMLLERDRTISLSIDAPVRYSRPSIDVLFVSAAQAFGAACTGVLLSGANDDGADGLRQIHEAGGNVLVQADAVHPTMPQAGLTRVGPATPCLPPREIASYLARSTIRPGSRP